MSYKIKEVRRWRIYGLLLAISAKIWQGQGIAASVRQHICYRYIIASKAVKFCSCLLCWSEHDLYLALRKNLCKNNQLQKNDFVLRAADLSLYFLFQYKLNTAVCQAPDAKYPDATERSAVKSRYFAAHQFSLSGYIISSSGCDFWNVSHVMT